MARKSFTRLQIQEILETNTLNAQVCYIEREDEGSSPDNFIIYFRVAPNRPLYADDGIHMKRVLVEVVHFHKKKLGSIEDLMLENFRVEPIAFNIEQPGTDYYGTYYRFECFTSGSW